MFTALLDKAIYTRRNTDSEFFRYRINGKKADMKEKLTQAVTRT